MKIIVTQFYTNNVPYGKYAEEINRRYCELHGYTYYVEKHSKKIMTLLEGRSPTWYKPHLIREILAHNPDCSYVLFLDIDAVITNHNKRIEEFLKDDFSIMMTTDYGPSLVNAGVMIVKNDEFSLKFLDDWWSICDEFPEYKTGLWHDQTCIGFLHERLINKEKFLITTNKEINSSSYKNNEFIFHAFSFGNLRNRTIDRVYYDIFNIEPIVDSNSLMELGEIFPTDKHYHHNYFAQVYQDIFSLIRNDVNLFLEIGVLDGNSLRVFSRFFKNATILGIDLKDEFIDNELRVFKCDQSSREDLIEFSNNFDDFDIILDDGSHKMLDQQITFAVLFKKLKSGGLFIIENLQTSVECLMPDKQIFQWGDPNKTTTLQMLEHYNISKQINSHYLMEDEVKYLTENIDHCEIYYLNGKNSITSIIKKK